MIFINYRGRITDHFANKLMHARNTIIKEEDRISAELLNHKKSGHISEELYKSLKPVDSRPAQLYGLAKVHKEKIPLRPIVSIPGTSYHKIGKFISH